MAKRSGRISYKERDEQASVWGLFGILKSCQVLTSSPTLISNGRAADANQHNSDHATGLNQDNLVDEEFRNTGSKVDCAIIEGSVGVEDKRKTKNCASKSQRHSKMDSGNNDCAVETQNSSRKSYKSSSSRLSNADSALTSASESLNKLEFAELGRHYQDKDLLSNGSGRSIRRGKYDLVDRMNMQQVQMRAKALADQMFIESLICKQGKNFESKSFSHALQVLNLDKDVFMDMWSMPDSNSLQSRRVKNTHHSQTEEELLKTVLDSKVIVECKTLDASSSLRNGTALASKKKMKKPVKQAIDYPCLCSSNASAVVQTPDKKVVSKPRQKHIKHVENVSCHCSAVPSHRTQNRTMPDEKPASFSFRGMKNRLKHTFGAAKGEPSRVPGDGASDDCMINGTFRKKVDLDGTRGPANSTDGVNETGRKKVNSSGVGDSRKPEFDVVLEAKRHLSARLKNIKDAEAVDSEKSFKTLMRILASPEHDLWPSSPGREHQNCSCSAQMRYSPYGTSSFSTAAECSSHVSNRRKRGCLNPSRPDSTAVTSSCWDQRTSGETCQANVPATNNKNFNDDSTNRESNPTPELHIIADESFTLDDLPSTPSSTCQLADTNKFHEEHTSPVSVLDPIFTEDTNSPQSTALQTAQQLLQPLHLDFEEHSIKLIPRSVPINTSSCIDDEQDHLSEYVRSVLQASFLSWDRLSDATCVPTDLLREVECPPCGCHIEPKLLSDHIIEVLLEIQESCFTPPSPLLVIVKPKIMSMPLQEVVLDKIMRETEFHVAPQTERTTALDHIVSKDVANCRSWLDFGPETVRIAADISEDFLEECIGDMILELLV